MRTPLFVGGALAPIGGTFRQVPFAFLTFRDFFAINHNVPRRLNAQAHLIPADLHDGHGNGFPDPDDLADSAR